MKKTLIVIVAMVFTMGCATKQLEAQIDEQQNMLLAKSKEVKLLEAEIKERDKMISELKDEMDKLEGKMLLLEADASYLKDLEYMHSELADEKMRLEDENEMLRAKLEGKTLSELEEILVKAEAKTESKASVESETKVTAVPPYPTVPPVSPMMPPMMPPMAGMGMPFGAPMMPAMQTFQSFPVSMMGYTYAPPPDNTLNIKISGEAVNEGTYFLVKVNGKEILFPTEPPRPMVVDGKAVAKTLLPPEVDAYIPVDNTGPYTVTLQACIMNGSKCVPNEPACVKQIKHVQKGMVLARACD